jgi:hypothetical protein
MRVLLPSSTDPAVVKRRRSISKYPLVENSVIVIREKRKGTKQQNIV